MSTASNGLARSSKPSKKNTVTTEISELLAVAAKEEQPNKTTVTQKFSQSQNLASQRAGCSQRPSSSQMLDKHYAGYGGTSSQIVPSQGVAAASQVSVVDGTQTQEVQPEPLLEENPNRFVILPIQYHDVWKMYKD